MVEPDGEYGEPTRATNRETVAWRQTGDCYSSTNRRPLTSDEQGGVPFDEMTYTARRNGVNRSTKRHKPLDETTETVRNDVLRTSLASSRRPIPRPVVDGGPRPVTRWRRLRSVPRRSDTCPTARERSGPARAPQCHIDTRPPSTGRT